MYAYIYVKLCFQSVEWSKCRMIKTQNDEFGGFMVLQLFEATIYLFDHFGHH
jgi:hypothetical protein